MSDESRFITPKLPPLPSNISQTVLLLWVTFMFVLGYWLFARYFEQIDLAATIPSWYPGESMPLLVRFVLEMGHWRVLRHLLPIVVGWWLARQAAVALVRVLYDLPTIPDARRFLSQLIYSGSAAAMTPVTLTKELLNERRDQFVVLRIGGPGQIRIRSGYVAVTELNGRTHRVVGTGTHYLDPFEYVHDVLDLRSQERFEESVTLISKDGIPITAMLSIQFRIDTGGEQPSRTKPYPFDETAVKIAAYDQLLQSDDTLARWDDAPLEIATSQLIRIFSKHDIDTILAPLGSDDHGISSAPLLSIRNELTYKLKDSLNKRGIELIDVQISQVELPEAVSSQYIKYWQSQSDARIRLSLADGEATALEEMELAGAEAEVTMIQAILEGVHRAKASGHSANMRDVVALRLVEALEKMARQTHQGNQLPEQQTILTQLDTFRQQLSSGTAVSDEPVRTFDDDELLD